MHKTFKVDRLQEQKKLLGLASVKQEHKLKAIIGTLKNWVVKLKANTRPDSNKSMTCL